MSGWWIMRWGFGSGLEGDVGLERVDGGVGSYEER